MSASKIVMKIVRISFSVLIVVLIVAFFAVIRQKVKRIINNKLNKDRNE